MFSSVRAKSNSIRPKPPSRRRSVRTIPLSAAHGFRSRASIPLPIRVRGAFDGVSLRIVMAAFAYSAIDARGFELRGEIHAPDPGAAREQLRMRGLLAQQLDELPAYCEQGVFTVFKKIKSKSLQIKSRQFATMIDAGLSVVGALVILEEQTEDKYLGAVISELRADV